MMNNFQMPIQLMKMLRGGSPEQILKGMAQQNSNPMLQNVMSMIDSNDSRGIEQLARNLCKSKGIDVDELMRNVQNQFG